VENLYPLQNGVLNLVKKLNTPFFLTGGTALSRFYFNHRYSDDLDFFVINDSNYNKYVRLVLSELSNNSQYVVDLKDVDIGKSFTRIFLTSSNDVDLTLQLDFINDIASHFGSIFSHVEFGKIDGWRNILSNKLTALFRSEPKDVVDIWIISKNKSFNWEDILNESKSKEVGVTPEIVFEILKSFPIQYINQIKWVPGVDYDDFELDIELIANDILFGRDNSLFEINNS